MISRIAITALALCLFTPTNAEACSCRPTTVEASWLRNTDTFVVDVLGTRVVGDERHYRARVVIPLQGCTTAGQVITLVTARDGATCGVQLTEGQRYVAFGDQRKSERGMDVFAIHLCDAQRPVQTLTASERGFLASRYVVCTPRSERTCVDGSDPVSCFANPCEVATCETTRTTCVPNYCGGCNAEFFDSWGALTCET